MAKNDFFQNVRRAVGFVAPRAVADNPYTKPHEIERALRGATIWLTPRSVEGFDPRDFGELSPNDRDNLATSVESFVDIARKVDLKKPATADEVDRALPRFMSIFGVVQKSMRDEWRDAAEQLSDQARIWAEKREWPCKRYPKQISEDLIGAYELTKLVFAVEGSQLVLSPVGRFVPGSEGMFDLAVLPDYETAMVIRHQGKWFVQSFPDKDVREEWTEAAFIETSLRLARLA